MDKESGEKRQRLYVAAQRIIYLGNGKGHGQAVQDPTANLSNAAVPFSAAECAARAR